jgi:zinc D-Ala-D-Ala carboxypeptidase
MAKHFKKSEFECKCGCGLNNIDAKLVSKLDEARDRAKTPFVISSGCRCITHNTREGGKSNSTHLSGLAVDIKCSGSKQRKRILKSLLDVGFQRLGLSKNFIHVDIDDSKPQEVMWTY